MLKIIYTLFMGSWRDSFGKSGWNLPIYKNRFVQHVVAFLMTSALCFFDKGMAWYWCLWVALWIQIEWALSHGPCYDLGNGGKPDEKMIKRYEKMVGYKLLCKIFPQDKWYTTGFDFCLLAIRYTYPLIPICPFFNPTFLCLGLLISALYGIYRSSEWIRSKRFLDVEIWAGFALGMYVAFL